MTSSRFRKDDRTLERLRRKASTEVPVLTLEYGHAGLLHPGPIITTGIGITQSHADALTAAGQPIPQEIPCRFLLDTGADGCVVKHDIAQAAGLKLIREDVPLRGVGVDTSGKVYMGRIWFGIPSRKAPGMHHRLCVDTQIASGELADSQILDGIIGRNILGNMELLYNGRTGRIVLRFLKP